LALSGAQLCDPLPLAALLLLDAQTAASPATTCTLPLALLLGLIQGLTEFLPISSSGHLVITQALFRMPQPGIALEVTLHAGTLVAVIVTFARDLWKMIREFVSALVHVPREGWRAGKRCGSFWLLVLATLPVVGAGLVLRRPVEAAFESPRTAALFLVGTGFLLLATRLVRNGRSRVNWGTALLMGIAQVVSLLPGVSRSGATISGGLLARGDPERVVRFSFLMSVPAILGSLLLNLPALADLSGQGLLLSYAGGFAVAFLSGLAAIQVLLRVVSRGRFYLFGIYCLIAGTLAWFVLGRI
jgi:undecaprenyl-diphosphatase